MYFSRALAWTYSLCVVLLTASDILRYETAVNSVKDEASTSATTLQVLVFSSFYKYIKIKCIFFITILHLSRMMDLFFFTFEILIPMLIYVI